ncbi:MAG: protein kinase [Fimbriimonadaceae bacterium]|nr:protein kinase [Fimbriimonadaceae bacterium]
MEGGGGQSVTYTALDKHSRNRYTKTVFVKQYRDLEANRSTLQSISDHYEFLMERLGFKSTYVVPPIAIGCEQESVVAVFPLIRGQTLEKHWEQSMDWESRFRVAVSIVAGCAELHRAGIAHCDIKPANLLIELGKDTREYVKFIDFDSSLLDGKGIRSSPPGTPGYRSPEHLVTGEEITTASDIFSVGIILCQLFLGESLALEGDDGTIQIALSEKFEFNKHFLRLLLRCLANDPASRPKADQLMGSLHAWWNRSLHAEHWFERLPISQNRQPYIRFYSRVDKSFERVYFEDTVLDWRSFKGLGKRLDGLCLQIEFLVDHIVIKNLGVRILSANSEIVERLDELRIRHGRSGIVVLNDCQLEFEVDQVDKE